MFKVEFSTDSAAFKDLDGYNAEGRALETARILGLIRSEVWAHKTSGTIQDYNGNTIGKWELTKEA